MKKKTLRPFHLAFPVNNIENTIIWYEKNLLCTVGRKDDKWVDLNFFGHQISAHLVEDIDTKIQTNPVDGHQIPSRHFGIILEPNQWEELAEKLKDNNINFIINPSTRFKGCTGEQSTMFVRDPSGNVLEFKSFKDDKMIFST